MTLPSKLYDTIKYVVLIAIPAFSTGYIGMDAALDGALPYENQVVKGLAVLALLLGTLVGISAQQYKHSDERFDGTIDPYYANAATSPAALYVDNVDKALGQEGVLLKVRSIEDGSPTASHKRE